MSLAVFIEYLDEIREFDRWSPELRQGEWLLKYFAFDDRRSAKDPSARTGEGGHHPVVVPPKRKNDHVVSDVMEKSMQSGGRSW